MPFLRLLESANRAILIPSSFFLEYSSFTSFNSWQYILESLTSLLYYFNKRPRSLYLSSIFPRDYFYRMALNCGSLLLHLFQYRPNPWAIFMTFESDFLIFDFNTRYCFQLFQALTRSCLLPQTFIRLTIDFMLWVSFSLFLVKYYFISSGSNPYFTRLLVTAFISEYPSLVMVSADFLI